MSRKIQSIAVLFVMILTIIINGCKKDNEEKNAGNQLPVVSNIEFDPPSISWNTSCQICLEAIDPEGGDLSYHWTNEEGEFETSTEYPCITWRSPAKTGECILICHIYDGIDTLNHEVVVTVNGPTKIFSDDFSDETAKWNFVECDHYLEEGVLYMKYTDPDYQCIARTNTFSPYPKAPWTLSGEVAWINPGSAYIRCGLSVRLGGSTDVTYTALFIDKYNDTTNWIWAILVPSYSQEWVVWDGTCYGSTTKIHSDGQMNHLELSFSATRRATVTINGSILTKDNSALNAMENALGINTSLKVANIALRADGQVESKWDNISFYSTGFKEALFPSETIPMTPPEDNIKSIFRDIHTGEIVTMKSRMLKETPAGDRK